MKYPPPSPSNDKLNFLFGLLIAIGSLSFIFLIVAIVIYGIKFPYLSNQTEDWAYFGSFISGILSFIAASITSLSLLALLKNNKSQHDFMVKERESIDLEIYLKHRSLFIENLSNIDSSYKNQLMLNSPDLIYRLVFPSNRPTQSTRYTLMDSELNLDTTKQMSIGGIIYRFNDICHYVESFKGISRGEATKIINETHKLCKSLDLTLNRECFYGDFIIESENSGINLFSFQETLCHIRSILEFVLFFTGSESSIGLLKVPDTNTLKSYFITRFSESTRIDGSIEIHKYSKRMALLLEIHETTLNSKNRAGYGGMALIYFLTSEIFKDKESASRVDTPNHIDFISKEFTDALNEIDELITLEDRQPSPDEAKVKHLSELFICEDHRS